MGTVVNCGQARGFVIEDANGTRYVITAGHCLPHVPPAMPAMYTEEKTFLNLIGALDQEAAVAGECLFVDPISDLAVVGAPDGEMFPEDREAWEMLLDPLPAFPVGDFRDTAPVLLHSLDCTWQEARAKGRPGRGIWLENARSIEGGMSGSPIVLADGAAVGVLSVSGGNATGHTKGGPQPRLRANLPGWLLAAAR